MLDGLGLRAVQLALVPLVQEPDVWAGAVETLSAAGIHVASGMLAMAGEDYSTLETIRATGGARFMRGSCRRSMTTRCAAP
jgi:hypothetical protein